MASPIESYALLGNTRTAALTSREGSLQGRTEEARRLFVRLLALRNDVGLLAEEYDPRAGRQLGNFPQAMSHIALVNTAANLCDRGPMRLRAHG